ncbi:MAG: DinB family protein [Acidimicrobiales bacterium]
MNDETDTLIEALDNQRAHVLGILDGLTGDALRHPVLPSGWTCLGLVQHLALDVERFWFHQVVAGEKVDHGSVEEPGSAWQVRDDVRPATVFDRYRHEAERANKIIAGTPMDAEPRAWPEFFGEWRLPDLRSVVLHVITETACHAGHLDAARELPDGRTWLVLNS